MGRALAAETAAIERDSEAAEKLASDTAAVTAEVARLKTQPHVFQNSRRVRGRRTETDGRLGA